MKRLAEHIKAEIEKCDKAIKLFEADKKQYLEMLEEIRLFRMKNYEMRRIRNENKS